MQSTDGGPLESSHSSPFSLYRPEITLPPQPAADPAPAKASNDLAPCKPQKYVAARARPPHASRFHIRLGAPDQLHQVMPKGHLSVHMSRVDNISTFRPQHARTSWHGDTVTIMVCLAEVTVHIAACELGVHVPVPRVQQRVVREPHPPQWSHPVHSVPGTSRPYCNLSFSNRTHKVVAIHCFKIEQRQRACRYRRPSRR